MALAYRSDIDAMRAVAVVIVLLFHFDFAIIRGGYVGVDVFFVISGFLITSIILSERDTFSIATFYARRARRILPALLLVIGTSLAAAMVLFIPQDLARAAESAVAAIFFVSNFLFQDQSGYFDAAGHLKPLLHTWSLAIEEQFYLVHPIFLLALAKLPWRGAMVAGLMAVFAASLAISAITTFTDPLAAYYLLPARAWELATGSLLAVGLFGQPNSGRTAALASLCGLALIITAATTFSESTAFPGVAALMPVAGAAMMIWAGQRPSALTPALAWRPLVWIGLISYSLYLWHWPVLVFARYANGGELDAVQTALALAMVLVLAIGSYFFVERPARAWTLPDLSRALGGGAALVGAAACIAWLSGGLPQRLSPETAAVLGKSESSPRLECVDRGISTESGGSYCVFGAKGRTPSFVLVGDSHANAVAPAVFKVAADIGRAGYFIWAPGFCPLPGVTEIRNPDYSRPMPDFIALMAKAPQVKRVVVVCYWGLRVSPERQFRKLEFRDAGYDGSGRAYNRTSLARGLSRLTEALPGRSLVLFEDVPTGAELDPKAAARLMHVWGDAGAGGIGLDWSAYERQRSHYLPILQSLAAERPEVEIMPVSQYLCGPTRCLGWLDGRPLYRDDDHIARDGAMLMADAFRRAIAPSPAIEPAASDAIITGAIPKAKTNSSAFSLDRSCWNNNALNPVCHDGGR